jgi:HEAT repeat protein
MDREFKDFDQLLDNLQDEQMTLTSEMLFAVSDMNRNQRQAFAAVWPRINVERRREIIHALVEVTENNIEFDFNAVLRLALIDEDPEVRAKAIYGLSEDEDPELIGPLLQMLQRSEDAQVREQAAISLGRFILLGELGDLDMPRTFAVQEALLDVYNDPQEDTAIRCRALESLAYSSDAVVQDLMEAAYDDKDERLTHSALFAMGRSADPRWQHIVISELESSKSDFRFEAAQACGKLELVEAVHILGGLAQEDPDQEVRGMAIWALGQIGDTEARRIINNLWDRQEEEGDENEFIRLALVEAQEEISFQDEVLDMSYFENDWEDGWDDDWSDEDDLFEDDGDDGSNGHDR